MSNVCLIEHAVIVLIHLAKSTQIIIFLFEYDCIHLLQVTVIKRTVSHIACLTSPEPDNGQCSSTLIFLFTCGPAARRASLAEVKASLGFAGCSSFAFLPPALAAAAARLFGGMILTEDPAQKLAVVIMRA